MIQRRARAAELRTRTSAHSFRATGITTNLQNGGKLEIAQQMAGHERPAEVGAEDALRPERGRKLPPANFIRSGKSKIARGGGRCRMNLTMRK
jgi:hypothetical protein